MYSRTSAGIVVLDLRPRYLVKQDVSRFVLTLWNRHGAKPDLNVQLSCDRLLLPLMLYCIPMHVRNILKAETFDRAETRM